MKEQNNFVKNLKALRMSNGMTLAELSEKTGVGERILGNYETARTEPPLGVVFKLADALEVKVTTLLTAEISLKVDIKENNIISVR